MPRYLILGGSLEANRIAREFGARRVDAIYSYAGRTQTPLDVPIPIRKGGFGGIEGLVDYLVEHDITHVIDATHPFAQGMSANAIAACQRTEVELIRFERAPWEKRKNWISVESLEAARSEVIRQKFQRVFLATGKQSLHIFAGIEGVHFIARIVDAPVAGHFGLVNAEFEIARGPFDYDAEKRLFESLKIDVIVSKNSGGNGAFAKIDAAEMLQIPIIMIERSNPLPAQFYDVEKLLAHLFDPAR